LEILAHRRLTRVHGTSLERGFSGLRSLGLRAYVVHTQGADFDARCWPGGLHDPTGQHAILTIPLRGRYLSFRQGGALTATALPGDAVLEQSNAWQERWQDDLRALVLQWAPPFGRPGSGALRLDARDRQFAVALADAIEAAAPGRQRVPPEFSAFWERLRSLGVALVPMQEMQLPAVPDVVSMIEGVVSPLLCAYETAPSAQDLVDRTGFSDRHLRRLFDQHAGWMGSFRERRQHGRLTSAVSWLTETNLSLERIAPSLGYGSGRALARALDDVGFAGRQSARRAR
jgi:AraC-like DNA-binding protein